MTAAVAVLLALVVLRLLPGHGTDAGAGNPYITTVQRAADLAEQEHQPSGISEGACEQAAADYLISTKGTPQEPMPDQQGRWLRDCYTWARAHQ